MMGSKIMSLTSLVVFSTMTFVSLYKARADDQDCQTPPLKLYYNALNKHEAPTVGEPPSSSKRLKIINAAASMIGKVHECGGGKGGGRTKRNWEQLAEFYKSAFERTELPESWLNGIKANGGGTWPGPWSWCGIFAVWAVRQAGVDAKWGDTTKKTEKLDKNGNVVVRNGRPVMVSEPAAPMRLKLVYGRKGIQPGDIVFFTGGLNHHSIVERVTETDIYTIDGNQTMSGIMRRVRPISQVAGYYSTEQ